jgi:hypothetical protein
MSSLATDHDQALVKLNQELPHQYSVLRGNDIIDWSIN